MPRRSPEQVAAALEARVRSEQARVNLARLKLRRQVLATQTTTLSTYRAAARDRTNRDWRASGTSADSAIIPDRATLDARSRQMSRDDAYAASTKRSFVRNVVGRGVMPAASATTPDGTILESWNKAADDRFWNWSHDPRRCDIERRRSFAAIQRWAIRELIEVGEAFVIRSIVPEPRRFGDLGLRLVLQLIEAEQIDRYKVEHRDPVTKDTREVRGGVEVDIHGAPVAYWVYHRHPHDTLGFSTPAPLSMESYRIPAERMCHIFDPERARQTRGVSRLSPSMERLRNLQTYDFAQLLAAKAEACIGLIIKSERADQDLIGMAQPASDGGPNRTDEDGNDELAMQPFMTARLAPGEDVTGFTPQRPGNMYEPFVSAQIKAAAAGAGISYEQVARDFTKGSYSSQRQSMLEDRREFEPIQDDQLIAQLCRPVWEDWLDLQVLNGDLVAPGYTLDLDRWRYCEWRANGWPWIDPKNEADAATAALKDGLTTRRTILAEKGEDWREVMRQQAEEEQYQILVREQAASKYRGLRGRSAAPASPAAQPVAPQEPQPASHPEPVEVPA